MEQEMNSNAVSEVRPQDTRPQDVYVPGSSTSSNQSNSSGTYSASSSDCTPLTAFALTKNSSESGSWKTVTPRSGRRSQVGTKRYVVTDVSDDTLPGTDIISTPDTIDEKATMDGMNIIPTDGQAVQKIGRFTIRDITPGSGIDKSKQVNEGASGVLEETAMGQGKQTLNVSVTATAGRTIQTATQFTIGGNQDEIEYMEGDPRGYRNSMKDTMTGNFTTGNLTTGNLNGNLNGNLTGNPILFDRSAPISMGNMDAPITTGSMEEQYNQLHQAYISLYTTYRQILQMNYDLQYRTEMLERRVEHEILVNDSLQRQLNTLQGIPSIAAIHAKNALSRDSRSSSESSTGIQVMDRKHQPYVPTSTVSMHNITVRQQQPPARRVQPALTLEIINTNDLLRNVNSDQNMRAEVTNNQIEVQEEQRNQNPPQIHIDPREIKSNDTKATPIPSPLHRTHNSMTSLKHHDGSG